MLKVSMCSINSRQVVLAMEAPIFWQRLGNPFVDLEMSMEIFCEERREIKLGVEARDSTLKLWVLHCGSELESVWLIGDLEVRFRSWGLEKTIGEQLPTGG
ncbi:hypothetical protein Droror1_Dr00002187 [Drosera rotundifolia]